MSLGRKNGLMGRQQQPCWAKLCSPAPPTDLFVRFSPSSGACPPCDLLIPIHVYTIHGIWYWSFVGIIGSNTDTYVSYRTWHICRLHEYMYVQQYFCNFAGTPIVFVIRRTYVQAPAVVFVIRRTRYIRTSTRARVVMYTCYTWYTAVGRPGGGTDAPWFTAGLWRLTATPSRRQASRLPSPTYCCTGSMLVFIHGIYEPGQQKSG